MMNDLKQELAGAEPVKGEAQARRDFLACLGKWSVAVIGGVALAGILGQPKNAEAYVGGWINRRGYGGGTVGGGGGGGWVNRRGAGGGWVNYR